MKIYTIIGGVNGAGKSSLTGALKAERTDLGVIVDVDKMAVERKLGAVDAGKAAIKTIDDCLQRGVSFTQETTLSGVRTETTVRKAKDAGYYVRLYYVGLNTLDESLKRIENRVAKGGHNIAEDDVQRRFNGRFDALIRILPYCDEVILFDNENGFVEVAEYKNGELLFKGDHRPLWLKELRERLKSE